ncbi:Methionine import ATP-binding protein MetN 1 [Dissostichus eleginoides]|uniref:Methionine import ATP-binding protein MetN 1 n=1 Tax=Dissostichus eleginoides TaxID=100907 RepID=A0AAD9B4Y0_DISEL|nr:Methionine import ATP-binding protein MetN 1 [Dissostichus eleginoides]
MEGSQRPTEGERPRGGTSSSRLTKDHLYRGTSHSGHFSCLSTSASFLHGAFPPQCAPTLRGAVRRVRPTG